MKKGILWLSLSLILVASLVLSSCTKTTAPATVTATATTTAIATTTTTATTTATTTSATTTAASTEPVYGQTLSVIGYRSTQAPVSWDLASTNTNADYYIDPYAQFLLTADIDGQGPRGTNAYSFQTQGVIPSQYLTGQLATSYEQTDPLTIIFHLRKGVMWTPNANIGMAAREFVASDVVFDFNRYFAGPNGGGNTAYIASVTAKDNYTVTVKFKTYNPDWFYRIGYGIKCGMQPPESVAAGNGGVFNWKNQSGTGPFILTDYVNGAYASYTRNHNYWESTTIKGKSYQLPFAETLVYPIMPDISTQVAAIRTAKVDVAYGIAMTYKDTLKASDPDLITFDYLKNNDYQVLFRCDTGVFADVKVRRAMEIGTDLNAIAKAIFPGGSELLGLPLAPGIGDTFTPIDQLPASTKELFTYDLAKAKQLLSDAGYPNGLPNPVEITLQTDATQSDMCALLAAQWAKLGVTLKITPLPLATWTNLFLGHTYSDIIMASTGNADPISCLQYKSLYGGYNTSNYKDDKAAAMFNAAIATTDATSRDNQFKLLNQYVLDQVEIIGMPDPYQFGSYWPWVKNFYGEVEGGYINYVPIESRMWIDPAVKKKLGY